MYSKWDSIYKHLVQEKLFRNIFMAENGAYVGNRKGHGAMFTSPSPVGGLMAHWEEAQTQAGETWGSGRAGSELMWDMTWAGQPSVVDMGLEASPAEVSHSERRLSLSHRRCVTPGQR